MRKHSGFSRRLHEFALKGKKKHVSVFVSGPYGSPPRWDIYETIVLISASTGASFTLPILESLLQSRTTNCVKRVDFLLTAKQGEEIDFYVSRLHQLIDRAKEIGIELGVHIAVTQSSSSSPAAPGTKAQAAIAASASSSGSNLGKQVVDEKVGGNPTVDVEQAGPRKRSSHASADSHVFYASVRPDVDAFIRGPVESTGGETSVVVCGGPSLVSRVRNCVAALSDERAVHKGTGAQGIHLYAEEYSF